MGHDTRKHVFEVSDEVRFKPASSVTETSYKIKILIKDMILSNIKANNKGAGQTAQMLFANPWRRFLVLRPKYIYIYINFLNT